MAHLTEAHAASRVWLDALEIKRQVRGLNETKKSKEELIIGYLEQFGELLTYNLKDQRVVLTLKKTPSVKLDKAALAAHLGIPQKELSERRIAELVENGELSSDAIDQFYREETKISIKSKRAKKEDVDRLRQNGRHQSNNPADKPHQVGDVIEDSNGKGVVTKVATRTDNGDGTTTLTPMVIEYKK